jgi:ABC-type transport system involved in multi-copper enzyme maturation permease subunit
MRPLLWKEMRDLWWWVAGGLLLIGAFEVLVLTEGFNRSFISTWMFGLMPFSAVLLAVGLAGAQVARERRNRTLEYLLVRPVSPTVVVWSKFLAGTAVLALLVPAMVGLGFTLPNSQDTGLRMVREQVSYPQLTLTLFPRFWCGYALALFVSVLVDRAVKVAAFFCVLVITIVATAAAFTELAPFSGFVHWLPYIDGTAGLITAAKSAALSGATGVTYCTAAILLAAAAAALLNRSSERYMGNLGLIVAAAGLIGAATLSAKVASVRLPEVLPIGSIAFQDEADANSAAIVANDDEAAIILDDRVRFVDFSRPATPRQVAEIKLTLWTTTSLWDTASAAMAGDTVLLLGHKKALPVDDVEIAMVKPDGRIDEISMGPVRPDDSQPQFVVANGYAYVSFTHNRVCTVHAYELTSKREVASLVVDNLPPEGRVKFGHPSIPMLRRGSYIYVTTPSTLTAIDISEPAQPTVKGRLGYRPKLSFLYGMPRPLAWQDARLFDIELAPQSLGAYDLSDPEHPVAQGGLLLHSGMAMAGSGRALYRPWRKGVMEFRAAGDDLQALRYLSGGRGVEAMAVSSTRVYALTYVDERNRREVEEFR